MLSFFKSIINIGSNIFKKKLNTYRYRKQFVFTQLKSDWLVFYKNYKIINFKNLSNLHIKLYKVFKNYSKRKSLVIQARSIHKNKCIRIRFKRFKHRFSKLTAKRWRLRKYYRKRLRHFSARFWCRHASGRKNLFVCLFAHSNTTQNHIKMYSGLCATRQITSIFYNYRLLLHRAAVCSNQVKQFFFRDLLQYSKENLLLFQYQNFICRKKRRRVDFFLNNLNIQSIQFLFFTKTFVDYYNKFKMHRSLKSFCWLLDNASMGGATFDNLKKVFDVEIKKLVIKKKKRQFFFFYDTAYRLGNLTAINFCFESYKFDISFLQDLQYIEVVEYSIHIYNILNKLLAYLTINI